APADQVFSYDGLDRLTGATGGYPYPSIYGYAYDAAGNRTQQVINGRAYTLTPAANSNRYATIQSAEATYNPSYTAAGALKSDLHGTYAYSDRGRLKTATIGANSATYLYNAFEQRVVKF